MGVFLVVLLALLLTAATTYLLVKLRPSNDTKVPPSFMGPSISPKQYPANLPSVSVKIEVVASPLFWTDQSRVGSVIRAIATVQKFYHMGVRMTFPDEASMKTVAGKFSNVSFRNAQGQFEQFKKWPNDWKDFEKLSFELYADSFLEAPCPMVSDEKIKPPLASTKLLTSTDPWQLTLAVGEITDLNTLETLRDAVFDYAKKSLKGMARTEGELLYSIYSSYNIRTGQASALSLTCNTLVTDILQYLNIQRPPIFDTLRDALDTTNNGLQILNWTDPGAVQYFKELHKQIQDIINPGEHFLESHVQETILKILNPTYMISYTTEERTQMALFKVKIPQVPVTKLSITN